MHFDESVTVLNSNPFKIYRLVLILNAFIINHRPCREDGKVKTNFQQRTLILLVRHIIK